MRKWTPHVVSYDEYITCVCMYSVQIFAILLFIRNGLFNHLRIFIRLEDQAKCFCSTPTSRESPEHVF